MKIAIILPHFYPYVGGGETMFYDVARGMVERGHEVRVVAELVDEEHTGHKVVDGIQVWYCPWKSMFGHPFPRTKDIEPHIRWCDVVHTSIFTTAPVVSTLARKYHKPSLLSVYEVRGKKWFWSDVFYRALIYYAVEQFSCRQKFDVYHSVSDSTSRDIKKFCGKNKNVIRVYNANEVDPSLANPDFSLREYFGLNATDRIFLYYGRPGKTKGIQVYEKALLNLKKKNAFADDVKFCFVLGEEPKDLRKAFISHIEKEGLSDKVLFQHSLGRPDLMAAIMQADYVVVPSITEGFGFSALEACQLGTPLIYSDGCSLPEVTYGKVLDFANRDADQLEDRIKAVMDKGIDAFKDVPAKTFKMEDMIDGVEKILLDLVK
jgi:glycosyltransferase involved in cell wall biosynthesis